MGSAEKTAPLSQNSAHFMSPLEAQAQSTTSVSPPFAQTSNLASAPAGLQAQPVLVGGPQFVGFNAWPMGQMPQMQQMPQMPQMPQFMFCQGAFPMQQGGCAMANPGMPPVEGMAALAARTLDRTHMGQVPGAQVPQHGQALGPQQPGAQSGNSWGKSTPLGQQPVQKRTTSGKSLKKVEVPEERPRPKAIFVDLSGLHERQ